MIIKPLRASLPEISYYFTICSIPLSQGSLNCAFSAIMNPQRELTFLGRKHCPQDLTFMPKSMFYSSHRVCLFQDEVLTEKYKYQSKAEVYGKLTGHVAHIEVNSM